MAIVAALQLCSSDNVDANLAQAGQLIARAADEGAKFIVLPENMAIMGHNERDKLKVRETFGQGKIQTFLSEQAKNQGVWLVGGTIPMACDNNEKVRAASLLFNDQGVCVARYDKIHLFDVAVSTNEKYHESETIEPGNTIVTCPTPFGVVGLSVCYDLRFPELFRCLFNAGAEIIVLPSAFTVRTGLAHWEVLTRSRAIENSCYVIGAGQGGTHANGRQTYGHSLIIDPWGTIIAEKSDMEVGVITASIDLNVLRAIRQAMPISAHQRLFINNSGLNVR